MCSLVVVRVLTASSTLRSGGEGTHTHTHTTPIPCGSGRKETRRVRMALTLGPRRLVVLGKVIFFIIILDFFFFFFFFPWIRSFVAPSRRLQWWLRCRWYANRPNQKLCLPVPFVQPLAAPKLKKKNAAKTHSSYSIPHTHALPYSSLLFLTHTAT